MAAQRAGLRLLLQPDQRLLVLRRRRGAGGHGRRGAQHLRRPARLPRAPRRPGPGPHRQADVRLAVPRRRRPLRARACRSRTSGCRSRSRCTPTTARCSARRSAVSGAGRRPPLARRPGRAARGAAPHPGARHLALGAAAARAPPTRPPRAGGVMMTDLRSGLDRWPALFEAARRARAARGLRGRAPAGSVDRGGPTAHRRGGPALRHQRPSSVRRLRAADGPTLVLHRPRGVLRAARSRRPDRLRRGLHDRRLGRRRPRRLLDRAGRARSATLVPERAAAAARAGTSPGTRTTHRNSVDNTRHNIAHHYDLSNDLFATFLDETHDLLLGAVRPTGCRPRPGRSAPTSPPPRRRKIERLLDLTGVGPGSRRARDRHRLGRAGDPGRPARGAGPQRHALGRAAAAGPRSGSPPRVWPTGSTSSSSDYRRCAGELRRGGLGGDDRGGRPRVPAGVLPTSTTGWRPADGPAIQAILMPHDRMLATLGHLHLDQQVHLPRAASCPRSS